MAQLLLGVDLGTTNVKAVLYDLEGNIAGAGEAGSYRIISRHLNWAEQDATIWWKDTVIAIRKAIADANIADTHDIIGVSVSSQGMAMLPLDANGRPLTEAHIWMDRRGTVEAEEIEQLFGAENIRECFGVRSDPYYQIANILWFKKNQPDLWAKTYKIVKANTYINYKLTGEIAIDEAQAIMTMCYDLRTHTWCYPLGDLLGIDFDRILPRVGLGEEVLGTVTLDAAAETGLYAGTPVVIGGADTALALLDMGIMEIGVAGEITGTSSNNIFAAKKLPDIDSGISYFPPIKATEEVPILLYGPTNATGENVRWFRKLCGLEDNMAPDGSSTYAYLERLATNAAPGCYGLYYYPYLMGERAPLWNNDVRGMFIGLNTDTDRGLMLRAIYEGTCFAQREICQRAVKESGNKFSHMFVSGGCARSDIWMQIKASVLNVPVHVMTSSGGAPRGDAILAGYGIGIYKDLFETAKKMRHIDKTFYPVPEWAELYSEMYQIYIDMRDHLLKDFEISAKLFR